MDRPKGINKLEQMHSVMIKSTVTGVRILVLLLGGLELQILNLYPRTIVINWNNACEVFSSMPGMTNNKWLLIFLLNCAGNIRNSTTNYLLP